MARLARLFVVVMIVMVVSPASASTSRSVQCTGYVRSGHSAACHSSIAISHFNPNDDIDFQALVARVDSPDARSWRVTGRLIDAKGVVYYAWYCSATRSSSTMGSRTYVGRACAAWRKEVNVRRGGRTYRDYYTADISRPQQLYATASVGSCVGPVRGCRFVAKAVYLIS